MEVEGACQPQHRTRDEGQDCLLETPAQIRALGVQGQRGVLWEHTTLQYCYFVIGLFVAITFVVINVKKTL